MEMDLGIEIRKNGKITVIQLAGELDAYTASRFREVMVEAIEDGGENLIVSMGDVEYIDSSGLGALVGGLKRVSERKGKIVVVRPRPQVRKVFEITGLEKVFPLFEDEEEAVAALQDGSREGR
ncbi:MAG: STAS domain-containing protein [Armatimonadota bacterium]